MTGTIWKEFGPLRLALLGAAALCALFATAPGSRLSLEGWNLITTLVLPALAPLLLFGLLLEILMSSIQMGQAQDAERKRWQWILGVEILFVAALIFSWMPFFQAVLGSAP